MGPRNALCGQIQIEVDQLHLLKHMAKQKPKKLPTLTVEKMPEETEQQYAAWLLYCEAGSQKKTLEYWERVGQTLGEVGVDFVLRLGKKPSHTTIENWSKKYRWPERRDLRLEEELVELKDKVDRFRMKRKYLVTELLIQSVAKVQKQLKQAPVSILELKYLWEMHRTEYDESTGKTEVSHRIDESEQVPPTDKDQELGREIDAAIKKYYDKQR